MKISIIILNWNAAVDTMRCIRSIAGWQQLQPAIWVVDNASTDGSPNTIAKEFPWVQLIRNDTNLGYAEGNNQGLIRALAGGDGFILLLNNDAFVSEKGVIRLIDTLESNEQIGVVGPLLFDADQKDRLLAAGGRNIIRHFTTHIPAVTGHVPVQIVDYVPGTVLLGRADMFRRVGLLDKAYFFAGEIPDFCRRAKQKGYLTAVDCQARAYHELGRSSNWRGTLYVYYIIRNRFLFIRKFYPYSKFFYYAFWGLYSIALSIKVQMSGNLPPARAIRLGLWDGLRGEFGGQNERVLATVSTANGK